MYEDHASLISVITPMNYHFEPLTERDRDSVLAIFNYFVKNSFAAYPENIVGTEWLERIWKMTIGYPTVKAVSDDGTVMGFGFLRPYHPADSLKRTAEITYYILPEYTRSGLGKAMLFFLMEEAQKKGIDSLLANISSLNEQSLKFHEKHGFVECGRFRSVGRKQGKDFDVVWMQKRI